MRNPYENNRQAGVPIRRVSNPNHGRRRHGCMRWLWIGGIFTAILMLMCGMLTIGFLMFPPAPMDILVVGMDSRGNEGAVARTDSIMLINVDASGVKVSVLSIPRGLFVNVPNYGSQMINTANFLGEVEQAGTGMTLLKQTIEQNFGIQVDKYVRMDFAGFADLINAVGGVDINVERVVEDYAYPTSDYGTIQVRFDTGFQWMDGERALIYARTRHQDDDYRRAERQQQVLSAFVGRAVNPLTWGNLLVALNKSVETDLTIVDIVSIAPTALLNGGRFNQLVIDRDYILPGTKGPIPNYDAISPFITENYD